jgi:protein O-mannosyl-transferase
MINSIGKQVTLFLLLIVLLYINSIYGEFVFDDIFLIRDNPYIDNFNNFVSYFTSGTKELGGRPVRLTSVYIDTLLFGKNVVGHHISNIIYYMIFCVLTFIFCNRIFQDKLLIMFILLLFISHPLHTEGVAYLTGRKDILGGIFSMSSLIFADCFIINKKGRDGLFVILFFLLAIGTKEIYAILPLLYIALINFRSINIMKYWKILLMMLITAFAFIGYVVFIRNKVFFDYTSILPVYGDNLGVNFATGFKISAIILALSFFPFNLSADYTFNAVERIEYSDPIFFFSAGLIILFLFGAYYFKKTHGTMTFGFIWILICLLPVCQIVPYPEIISERSLIFLSFGSCVIIAYLALKLPRKSGVGVLICIIFLFSITTVQRNLDWQNEFTLWKSAVEAHPSCARARNNLGLKYVEKQQFQSAKKEFISSLIINPIELVTVPDYSLDALLNLGNIHAINRDLNQAEKCYKKVLSHEPTHKLAQMNLNIIKNKKQDLIEPPFE